MTLSVHDLRFRYGRRSPFVLDGVDLVFAPGAVTAVTGPSGTGKSTLLYVLGLLLTPQRGQVALEGRVVSGLGDAARSRLRARTFGFVFQDAALDQRRTVLDNVIEPALYQSLPMAAARRRARELLERFEVGVPVERRPGQVSGGQAQRIGLARALVCEPRVILADEPTGNLDSASTHTVLGALRDAAGEGRVVVTATHDHEVIAACDQVVTL